MSEKELHELNTLKLCELSNLINTEIRSRLDVIKAFSKNKQSSKYDSINHILPIAYEPKNGTKYISYDVDSNRWFSILACVGTTLHRMKWNSYTTMYDKKTSIINPNDVLSNVMHEIYSYDYSLSNNTYKYVRQETEQARHSGCIGMYAYMENDQYPAQSISILARENGEITISRDIYIRRMDHWIDISKDEFDSFYKIQKENILTDVNRLKDMLG